MLELTYVLIVASIAVAFSELSPAMNWPKPLSCCTCMAFWLSITASVYMMNFNYLINTGLCMIAAFLIRKIMNWPNSF